MYTVTLCHKEVVYIQITSWSRSLCVIIEKDFWNLDIFDREPKYAFALFACVLRFMFSLELFSTHLTLICFKCLLHMNKHLYEAIPVTFVERSSRINGTPPYYMDVDNPLT